MTPPTLKHQAFAREYVLDHNATQAAIRAGYSVHTAKQQGSRLLTNVDVVSEIAALEAVQVEVDQVNREFVISGLRDLALNAKTESSQVRAYELLGKHLRLFVDVAESTVVHDVAQLQSFSETELRLMLNSTQQQPAIEGEVRVLDS